MSKHYTVFNIIVLLLFFVIFVSFDGFFFYCKNKGIFRIDFLKKKNLPQLWQLIDIEEKKITRLFLFLL